MSCLNPKDRCVLSLVSCTFTYPLSHSILCPFFCNWLCQTSQSLWTSCHGCVVSFSLGSCLFIRCIVVWLWWQHLLLPRRWRGPSLLHALRWIFIGQWRSSSTPLLLPPVLLLLHCMRLDCRCLCWRVHRIFVCCCQWCYNNPPRGWCRQGVHWCILLWSGRTLRPL